MKLCICDDQVMLCGDARRHMGQPSAVVLAYDVLTMDMTIRAARPEDAGACTLQPVQRFGYEWAFRIDEPPIEPSGYRLRPDPDGSLTVDLTTCDT